MPRFMAHVVTDIEFVGGASEGFSEGYAQLLAERLQEAAKAISTRTIEGNKVLSVQVGKIEAKL